MWWKKSQGINLGSSWGDRDVSEEDWRPIEGGWEDGGGGEGFHDNMWHSPVAVLCCDYNVYHLLHPIQPFSPLCTFRFNGDRKWLEVEVSGCVWVCVSVCVWVNVGFADRFTVSRNVWWWYMVLHVTAACQTHAHPAQREGRKNTSILHYPKKKNNNKNHPGRPGIPKNIVPIVITPQEYLTSQYTFSHH